MPDRPEQEKRDTLEAALQKTFFIKSPENFSSFEGV